MGFPKVSGVWLGQFDCQVEFIGPVDLARYAVGFVCRDELDFGEVVRTISGPRFCIGNTAHVRVDAVPNTACARSCPPFMGAVFRALLGHMFI